ncbi:MAG: hypothetical protein ACLFVJ_04140 [Persicimonas sp.]
MPSTPIADWRRASVAAAALVVLAGCAAQDEGEFTLSGFEQHEACFSEASPLRPEMFTASDNIDAVSVSMQTDFRLPSTSDLVQIVVYQPEQVRERLGEPIELADPLELVRDDEEFDQPPVVRAELGFGESCPEILETFGLRGTIVFDELDADRGGHVSGQLVGAEAVSLRQERVIIGQVDGSWAFDVRSQTPYNRFPNYDDEPTRGPTP